MVTHTCHLGFQCPIHTLGINCTYIPIDVEEICVALHKPNT